MIPTSYPLKSNYQYGTMEKNSKQKQQHSNSFKLLGSYILTFLFFHLPLSSQDKAHSSPIS